MHAIFAYAVGLVFALGLGISGMTDPDRVLGFLDVASSDWDPSLMVVLGVAVGVYGLGAARVLKWSRPWSDQPFRVPQARRLDARLVAGAAVFGVGWGLAGLCPGPALVNLAGGLTDVFVFVAAMFGGMLVFAGYDRMAGKTRVSGVKS